MHVVVVSFQKLLFIGRNSRALAHPSPLPLIYTRVCRRVCSSCLAKQRVSKLCSSQSSSRVQRQTSLGQFRNTPYGTRQSRSPLVGRKCRPPLATRLPSSLLKTSIFSRCAELKRPHDMFFKKITSHPSRAPLTADSAQSAECSQHIVARANSPTRPNRCIMQGAVLRVVQRM